MGFYEDLKRALEGTVATRSSLTTLPSSTQTQPFSTSFSNTMSTPGVVQQSAPSFSTNLTGNIFNGLKSALDSTVGFIEKLSPVQIASKIQGGQSIPEAIKNTFSNTPNEQNILNRQLELVKQGKTAKQALIIATGENASNMAMGFINPESGAIRKIVPEAQTAVQRITNALTEAKPLIREQKALYSAERAKRAAQVAAIGQKTAGEAGYHAQLGALKGELPKVSFESVKGKIQQPDIDALFNQVEQHPILTTFEKIGAKTGLDKILSGQLPVKSELTILNEVFPPEFIDAVLSKRSIWQKLTTAGGEVLNLPRALMATADLSAPLRQGIFLVGRPKQWLPAFGDMFKYAFSEKAYQGLLENIQSRSTYKLMRDSGLSLTNTSKFMGSREEAFMSNIAEKIPLFGKFAKGSNRAYSGFLNKLRADTFDSILSTAKRTGVLEERPQVVDDISKFVNSATGRGTLGALDRASVALNGVLFSPRLLMSRINLLNPAYYTKLDPLVRKEALKSLLTFGATALSVLGLAKLGGASVQADPRSADFGKIKVGNTRYDILGGFQQYIRLASQLITGKVISSTTGKEITLGEGYKPLTRKDVLIRFLEAKEAPVLSFATALGTGKNGIGEPINIPAETIDRFTPMIAQDMYDLYKENGLNGIFMATPGLFGAGSQTYGKQKLESGVNSLGKKTVEVKPISGLGEDIASKVFGDQVLQPSAQYNADTYYQQLKKLSAQEARAQFDEIARINPDLAKKITESANNEKLGITVANLTLKSKGVASGDRARAIVEELNKLKTKEEKRALWEEYVTKKIITTDVAQQLLDLLSQTK